MQWPTWILSNMTAQRSSKASLEKVEVDLQIPGPEDGEISY